MSRAAESCVNMFRGVVSSSASCVATLSVPTGGEVPGVWGVRGGEAGGQSRHGLHFFCASPSRVVQFAQTCAVPANLMYASPPNELEP